MAQRTGVQTAHLGNDYWKLWGSSSVSTLGDGVYITVLMLIGASLTSDPVRLSTLAIASTLPWFLFSLLSGALVDRFDHLRVMWITGASKCVLLVVVTILVASGQASIWLLAAASFVLATGETLYVTASQSVVPRIVSRAPDRLQRANSWLVSAQIVLRDFMGRPVGGALFGVVAWLPVLLNAVSAGLGALLIARIRGVAPRPRTDTNRRSLPREVADGMWWLWRHRVLRTLALATCVNNLAFAGWTVILVLLLQDRFDVSGLGFGAMTACLGVGGLVGSFGAFRLSRRFGMAAVLFAAMLGEGLATAVLGLAPVWPLAVAMLLTIGGCAIGWNVVSVSLRQSIVPDDLLGRVNSAYRFLAVAGAPIGAAVGGVLARWQGLSAPFLVGALLIVVAAVGIAAVVTPRAVEAAQSGAEHR